MEVKSTKPSGEAGCFGRAGSFVCRGVRRGSEPGSASKREPGALVRRRLPKKKWVCEGAGAQGARS